MENAQEEPVSETPGAVRLPELPADVDDMEGFIKVGEMPSARSKHPPASLDPIIHRLSVSPAYGGHRCLSNWGEECGHG